MRGNSVRYLGHKKIDEMLRVGYSTSKFSDKRNAQKSFDGTKMTGIENKIYMSQTAAQYHRHWDKFCDVAAANGVKMRTMDDALSYMDRYLGDLSRLPGKRLGTTISAPTIHTFFAAPCKVLGVSADKYNLPPRRRRDAYRSRTDVAYDKHFSRERNAELINFGEHTGLRSTKEFEQIKGTDLIQRGKYYYIDVKNGKGGKPRHALIVGTPAEIQRIVNRMHVAGNSRVWPHVHHAADIHSMRAKYGANVYEMFARDPKALLKTQQYACRGDLRGTVWDKKAMLRASRQLGHNRIDVIAGHYMWLVTKGVWHRG